MSLENLKKYNKWTQSDACKIMCAQEQEKYDSLLSKGLKYFDKIDCIISEAKEKTVRVEHAVKGNLHRGMYCPSLVYELIVGGNSRGRILKRVTAASKITHIFGFDEQGQLLYAETPTADFFKEFILREYIIREDDLVLGVALNDEGNLHALSEEIYQGGKLQRYIYAELCLDEEKIECYKMHCEEYSYDELGLCTCIWTEYVPMCTQINCKERYIFERCDGYLHSYTVLDLIRTQIYPGWTNSIRYVPGIKRKA